MKLNRAVYRKETSWGAHEVLPGSGKHEGKFIAESWGWGGAAGYFHVFDNEQAAVEYVEHQTRPLPPVDIIAF